MKLIVDSILICRNLFIFPISVVKAFQCLWFLAKIFNSSPLRQQHSSGLQLLGYENTLLCKAEQCRTVAKHYSCCVLPRWWNVGIKAWSCLTTVEIISFCIRMCICNASFRLTTVFPVCGRPLLCWWKKATRSINLAHKFFRRSGVHCWLVNIVSTFFAP